MAQLGPRGLSDEHVRAKTGRSSAQWRAILDRFDVKARGHTAAARHLREVHKVADWWSQAVVIRYEYERGLRTDAVTVPADLRRAMATSATARAAFAALAPTHRREYVRWIEEAKRAETRARRLAQAVALLAAGQREPRAGPARGRGGARR